jgi:hypothetical protein
MLIGHYGPAVYDTQRGSAQPIIRLWEAFLAVQAMDLVAGILVMFSIEGGGVVVDGKPIFHIPWSHSLLGSLVIAAAAGLFYKSVCQKKGWREFWIIALLAFSHWLLDLLVHRPDLPIYPGGELMLGLALWDFPWVAFALEASLLAWAFWYWQRVTVAKNWKYDWGIWALYAFMCAVHFIFVVSEGLAVQAGTYDPNAAPPDIILGTMFLVVIGTFAGLIALIERGRPSKFAGDLSS